MKSKFWITFLICAVLIALVVVLICILTAPKPDTLWSEALYREDTEIGTGSKCIIVEVGIPDHKVVFTVHTDKATLAEALLEHELISGDEGPYGLYIKKVNGILADYDTDGAYWGLYSNGEMLMQGISETNITDGDHYELVYTK